MNKQSENVAFRDFDIFEKVLNFDNIRQNRIRLFVYIGITIVALSSTIWSGIWIYFGYPIAAFLTLCMLPVAFYIYVIVKKYEPKTAFSVLIFVISVWIFSVAILASGPGGDHGGSAHSYFLTLAALVYFIYIGQSRIEQWGITALLILLFFAFEMPFYEFEPLIKLDEDSRAFASKVTWIGVISTFFIFFVWISQDVYEVERRLNAANEKKSELLDNILPPIVVKKLSKEGKTFAEGIEACTVLFVDVVNFTALTRRLPPEQLVELLNQVFGDFDDIVKKHEAEKIKTIGDAYMAVSGVPLPEKDHALTMFTIASDFIEAVKHHPEIKIRVGIASGPVTAGIMGKRKILYDVWGQTVDVAMALEQSARPGTILLSEQTYELLDMQVNACLFGTVYAADGSSINAYEALT